MIKKLLVNKIFVNASWIIACKIMQSILNLFIGMITARYLGPSNYGLISYAASITAFFLPLMRLGFTSTLVQEFVSEPENEGKILGTSLGMNILASIASVIGIFSFCIVAHRDEKDTIIVCVLYGLTLLFQAAEMSQYWFQAKLLSKYPSVAALIAYFLVSIYKIVVLILNKSVFWFAVTHIIEAFVISVILMVIYHRLSNQKLSFSFSTGKRMLAKSKYYIVSGVAVIVLQYTDQFMLKNMIGDTVTGFYSAAITCAGMFNFIYTAIIDSMRPQILQHKKVSVERFEESLSCLYSIVFYVSLAQCVIITSFADFIVCILYGETFLPSANILRVSVWVNTFSFFGNIISIWILAQQKDKVILALGLTGAISNVFLNLILIPYYGPVGAAIASLLSQILKNVVLCFVLKPLRHSIVLMLQGINPKFVIKKMKCLSEKQS